MDIKTLIASIEVELEAAQKRQAKADAEIKLILDTARQEGRPNLTEDESKRTDELFANIELAKSQEEGIKGKLARARKVEAEEVERDAKAHDTRDSGATLPKYDGVARVGREERTYNPGSDPRGSLFLGDVVRGTLGNDVSAQSRLAHHMQEERVERAGYLERAAGDAATSVFGGLVVPQYLVDMTAPAVANMRPFADVCNHHQLPASGMTLTIPTITTATSATLQASQLAATTPVSIGETDLTINVQTAEGWQNVSRQAIERGNGIEDVTLQDLFKRYNTVIDSTLINQATNGLSAKATNNQYDDTGPTGAKLYPKIMGAMSGVEAALLAMGTPDYAVMHSRRWYWLSKEMTSTWPLINFSNIPVQAGAAADPTATYNSGTRGVLPNGLRVIVDNNIPTNLGVGTNQDEIYVVPSTECHLWEDAGAPAFIRAEQPNATALGVLLVVYGYFAYTFARYANGMQKVGGTSLVAPTF